MELRLKRQEASALQVARWLRERPEVAKVNHPGLGNRQGLAGTSSLFSIELGDKVDVTRFCDTLRLFRLGVSWGGHESLVFPVAVGLRQAGSTTASSISASRPGSSGCMSGSRTRPS
ncbi:MAG: PLP-dependent transferase [Geminicoccaceae bacterium]